VARTPHRSPELAIVIIDSRGTVHAGTQAWLTGDTARVTIVGSYPDSAGFLTDYPTATPAVDVVVLALTSDGKGPDVVALERLCRAGHRVVVFGDLVRGETILSCLDAGAVSYVVKRENGEDYIAATLHTGAGALCLGTHVPRAMSNGMNVGRPELTVRECEVLITWCHAATKHEVAEKLSIERATVSTHLQRIRAKYAGVGRPATTKAALIARAIQDGLVHLDEL
jgi:DNA-binding NarL/FixJ family response regulator